MFGFADQVKDTGTAANKVGELHHIATDKSIKTGWTAAVKDIFDKAGLDLNDPINKVFLEGHKGRHPQSYHVFVLNRLRAAVQGKKGDAYKKALKDELELLKEELKDHPELLSSEYWNHIDD